jgi:N4-gp56 family major capsid protein
MTTTIFGTTNPMTQKKWGAELAVDAAKKSWFEDRLIGTSDNHIIQRRTELESASGDRVSFDLCVQMRNKPTYGDADLAGKEESLKFYTDEVVIDQVRHGVSAGGKMTRKRVAHDLRAVGKARLADYFSRLIDELFFMYLSGARGINQDFIESDPAYNGFAGNSFQAPDTGHLLYGGVATSKASLAATDKMTKSVIEKANNMASMMQARNPDVANMVAVRNGSEDQYVCVMTPDQAYDMRNADTTGWMDIQKAAVTNEGRANPIFRGGLGMIGGTVLQQHRSAIRFGDYGAGANVPAARALFLGRQAGVIAYGTAGGMRFSWSEELKDHGNKPVIASGFIAGMKKTRFNNADFGVIAIDTAAKDPNS